MNKGRNKRSVADRRDLAEDRRNAERRREDRRSRNQRAGSRRKEFCPTCGTQLSPAMYCSVCKARVIKIRGDRPD